MSTSPASEFVRQVQHDRSQAAARLAELDRLLTSLRNVYTEMFTSHTNASPQPNRVDHTADNGADTDNGSASAGRSPSPLVEAVRAELTELARWTTVRELADLIRAKGAVEDDGKLEQNVRAAVTRRIAEVERMQKDGRTFLFRILPKNADSPTETVGLSDQLDLAPNGGEHTDGQGSHHDHRIDFAGRNGDRDHLGASVGH